MRKILFRGKAKGDFKLQDGKWVIGSLIAEPENEGYVIGSILWVLAIDNGTIGQYTGLEDKNGKKIFEGDIVRVWKDGELQDEGVVVFGYGSFEVRQNQKEDGICLCFCYSEQMEFEIIGNIYDNPELLGGK